VSVSFIRHRPPFRYPFFSSPGVFAQSRFKESTFKQNPPPPFPPPPPPPPPFFLFVGTGHNCFPLASLNVKGCYCLRSNPSFFPRKPQPAHSVCCRLVCLTPVQMSQRCPRQLRHASVTLVSAFILPTLMFLQALPAPCLPCQGLVNMLVSPSPT